ncbi:MAG: hypothetical protein M1335_05435 [Chloroflexi bacterium]|nr:hypothetical protein [Chloroflexota bacterium]
MVDIIIEMSGVRITLTLLEVMTFGLAIIIALAGLVTGLLSRRIWLIVEGELAASWGWVLPGFGVYILASGLRVLSVFLSNDSVFPLVRRFISFISPDQLKGIFVIFQATSELVFLALIVFGLIRQYRLFASLSLRE